MRHGAENVGFDRFKPQQNSSWPASAEAESNSTKTQLGFGHCVTFEANSGELRSPDNFEELGRKSTMWPNTAPK
jgi:hypothetical protein